MRKASKWLQLLEVIICMHHYDIGKGEIFFKLVDIRKIQKCW